MVRDGTLDTMTNEAHQHRGFIASFFFCVCRLREAECGKTWSKRNRRHHSPEEEEEEEELFCSSPEFAQTHTPGSGSSSHHFLCFLHNKTFSDLLFHLKPPHPSTQPLPTTMVTDSWGLMP